ncbi:MAG: calcium/sodium antiporter [Candidatus Nomurabacteria bacterium]|jgi:cation:H+ antiporter|nr:calcium/sodium antiporter [Candidatus Nomurabacteria bacterium]
MITNILLVIVGFALLIKCADFFVDGAASLAKHLRVPATVIGLTIVAFGTSSPELAVSVQAHLSGNTDMLVGNIVGSSIINIFLIIGISALIAPMRTKNHVVRQELPILLLITAGFAVMFLDKLLDGSPDNLISRTDGVMLVLVFSIFLYYLLGIIHGKRAVRKQEDIKAKFGVPVSVVAIIGGLAGIILGSNLVVDHASSIALTLGLSQKIIAVTIVSIGTSLPELITSVMAAKKGEPALALGNIIGSNIFNICMALGLPVIIFGSVSLASFSIIDVVYMILSVLTLLFFAATKRTISRKEGVVLVLLFLSYYVWSMV